MSDKSVKVVILGDSGIGKTSLIQRYVNQKNQKQNTTLGAVFVQLYHTFKSDEGKTMKLPIQYWDTAGQERYHALIPMYARDSDFIIICFDLTNIVSFVNLKTWIELAKTNIKNCKYVLVGCKDDIEFKREPSNKEIDEFIEKNIPGSKFFKTSSHSGKNINKLFSFIKKELEELGQRRVFLNSLQIDNYSIQVGRDECKNNTYYELGGKVKNCCF